MKKILILAIFVATVVFLLLISLSQESGYDNYTEIVFKERSFALQLAVTEEERVQGLSGREGLPAKTALLFVFPVTGEHGIWMKDMLFDIDIIWADEEMRVVDYREDVNPSTFPEIFYPARPSKYVVEANAGFVVDNGVEIGDYFALR